MTEIEKAVEEIGKMLPPTSQKAYEAGEPNAVWGMADAEFEKVNAMRTPLPMVVKDLHSRNGSFPAQWDGALENGLFFFCHYRHGYLHVTLGTTPDSSVLGVELMGAQIKDTGGEMETNDLIARLASLGWLDFSRADISHAEGY